MKTKLNTIAVIDGGFLLGHGATGNTITILESSPAECLELGTRFSHFKATMGGDAELTHKAVGTYFSSEELFPAGTLHLSSHYTGGQARCGLGPHMRVKVVTPRPSLRHLDGKRGVIENVDFSDMGVTVLMDDATHPVVLPYIVLGLVGFPKFLEGAEVRVTRSTTGEEPFSGTDFTNLIGQTHRVKLVSYMPGVGYSYSIGMEGVWVPEVILSNNHLLRNQDV